MEIALDKDGAVIQFSKHFLVKGWGLCEQERASNILIDFPQDWTLFGIYLKAMGNKNNYTQAHTSYDLRCVLYDSNTMPRRDQYLMKAKLGQNLEIVLDDKERTLKTWHFTLPNQTPSTELIQLSFFLSVTDSIKDGLLWKSKF